MSRNIGFALDGGFYDRRGDTIDPTDAERVELAIAALTHGTDREVPEVPQPDAPADVYLRTALQHVAFYRAALARDAAAKEAERAVSTSAHVVRTDIDLMNIARAVARHVLADAAQGEGAAS